MIGGHLDDSDPTAADTVWSSSSPDRSEARAALRHAPLFTG